MWSSMRTCGRGAPRRESGGCVLFHGGRVARGLGLALGVRVRVGPFDRLRAKGGGGWWGGAPRRAPLGSCLRRNDASGGGCFGIRFVAGVVQISYNSKSFCRVQTTSGYQAPKRMWSSMRTLRERGASAREWRLCAVPWGEGSAGVGVGARGSCQGGGRRGEATGTETPRAAPLWVPAFAGMTRAGVRGNDGGCVRGDALARGVGVRWGPPSCALRTSFDRLRANGLVERLRRGGGVWRDQSVRGC